MIELPHNKILDSKLEIKISAKLKELQAMFFKFWQEFLRHLHKISYYVPNFVFAIAILLHALFCIKTLLMHSYTMHSRIISSLTSQVLSFAFPFLRFVTKSNFKCAKRYDRMRFSINHFERKL